MLKRISSITLLFLTGACLLTGCAASRGVTVAPPPADTVLISAARPGSCEPGGATDQSSPGAVETTAVQSENGAVKTEAGSGDHLAFLDAVDPLEPVNRTIYSINTVVDSSVIEPAIRVYRKIVPLFVRERFSDFFSNLDDILVMGNCLLQTKGVKGGEVLGRFMINSTVGVFGLWDPATEMGLIKYSEDFGQTLGYYGVKPGPYVVLPLLGPSTVRDAAGTVADALGKIFFVNVLAIDPLTDLTLSTIDGLEFRASMPFSYGDFDSPFEYELVRTLYLDMRQLLVRDGAYRDEQREHQK